MSLERINNIYNKIMEFKGISNKSDTYHTLMMMSLAKTNNMFEYSGLPDTIPAHILESYLQINGFAIIAYPDGDKNKGLYAYFGGLGGQQDEYYRPTVAMVASPYQGFSCGYDIGENCAIIKNDVFYMGLVPLNNMYAELATESLLSMRVGSILTRLQKIFTAPNDSAKIAYDKYINDLINGKLSAVVDSNLIQNLEALNIDSTGNSKTLEQLSEYHRYILGTWYNELGLKSAYNMKRERLTDDEIQLDNSATASYINSMFESRKQGVKAVNDLFGTNISVKLGSVWRGMDKIKAVENMVESVQNSDNTNESEDNEK